MVFNVILSAVESICNENVVACWWLGFMLSEIVDFLKCCFG